VRLSTCRCSAYACWSLGSPVIPFTVTSAQNDVPLSAQRCKEGLACARDNLPVSCCGVGNAVA
jgi:hypothetical protein